MLTPGAEEIYSLIFLHISEGPSHLQRWSQLDKVAGLTKCFIAVVIKVKRSIQCFALQLV